MTERTLLPAIYPTTQPLHVTNHDGTLSNGDKLHGWRNTAFFVISDLSWAIAWGGVTVLLLYFWPRNRSAR